MGGKLDGRKALVTGAATGIGRAVAERFAAEGAALVLFGLGGTLLDEVAAATGGQAVHGDISNSADVAAAIAACDGKLDIIVNAAGILIYDDPETVTAESRDKTFAVNLAGAMTVCGAALPLLKQSKGAIVNIASSAAFTSGPGMTSYAASKAALVAYTRSIANAHGRDGVRANAVAPGWVRTPMSEREMDDLARANGTTREEEFAALCGRIMLRRVAEPSEIAACCLFLASDEASFVTGITLMADGGGRGGRPV